MKKEGKRGQVGIISVILLILISLVGVVIVSNIIFPLLRGSSEEISLQSFTNQVTLEAFKPLITGGAYLTVKSYSKDVPDGFKVNIVYQDGTTKVIDKSDSIQELETKILVLTPQEAETYRKISTVSISEVFGKKVGSESSSSETIKQVDWDNDGVQESLLAFPDPNSVAGKKELASWGLTRWWKLKGDTQDYINASNGELRNGAVISNEAVILDGIDDYVKVDSSEDIKYKGGNFTIALWVYVSESENTNGYFISKPWNGGGEYNYRLILHRPSGMVSIIFNGETGDGCDTPINSIQTNRWNFIGVTFNEAENVSIYIDKVLVVSKIHSVTNWAPSKGDANLPLGIGTLYPYTTTFNFPDYSLNGKINNVMLFNRTLSSTEMRALYYATR